MTPEEIAADRAVCDAATPEPWAYRVGTPAGVHQPKFECWIPQTREDAAFIAAARTRWPVALDEIERLRADAAHVCPCRCAEVERLRKELAELREEGRQAAMDRNLLD